MAEEIVFKTTVDTGNSVSAINNVDKALKSVDEQIKQTEKDIDDLSDSFGENSKEADDARKKLAGLHQEMGGLQQETTKLTGKFEDFYGELQPLTSRVGELEDRMYELALAGKANTKEFIDLQAEAVRMKQAIISVDKATDQLQESGRGLGTALQIGTTVVAGYGAVEGAMALMGNESEELQKTMVKLQGAQALLNGLQELKLALDKKSLLMMKATAVWDKVKIASEYAYTTAIGTSTGALKLARLAMLALPIVAIIAGLVAIAGAMGAFSSSTDEATEKQKKFDEQQRKSKAFGAKMLQEDYEKTKNFQDKKMELDKAKGLSDDELYAKEQANLQLRLNMLKFATDKNKEQVAEMRAVKQQILVNEAQHLTDLRDKEEQSAEERAKNREKRNVERLAKEKADSEKQLELSRTIEDLIIANIQDSDLRQLEELRVRHEREKTELIKNFGNNTTLLKELTEKQSNEVSALNTELLAQRTEKEKEENAKILELKNKDVKASLEAKLINIREDFELEQELKLELAKLEMEQALQQEDLTNGEKLKIQAEYQAKLDGIKKDGADKEKALQLATIQQGLEIAEKAQQSIQNLSDIVFTLKMSKLQKGSAEEEKYARKQFEINKAMQISGAIIDGAKAVTATMAVSPPVTPMGIASLTAVITTSVASIAKIASTKFGGTGGGGVNTPTVPTNNGGGTDANSTQANNMGNTSQVSSVGLIDNSTGIKVTVVDSEIKAVMDASAQTNVVSTLGG